jgi:hypothetical protein
VSWQRAQSNPRTRPGWTYLRGAARDSGSSMYKLNIDYDVVIHLEKKRKKIKILCIAYTTNLFISVRLICLFSPQVKNKP